MQVTAEEAETVKQLNATVLGNDMDDLGIQDEAVYSTLEVMGDQAPLPAPRAAVPSPNPYTNGGHARGDFDNCDVSEGGSDPDDDYPPPVTGTRQMLMKWIKQIAPSSNHKQDGHSKTA